MGTPTNITWDIIGTSQVFDLDYSTDNGNTWHRIVNDYSQTGSTVVIHGRFKMCRLHRRWYG